MKKILDTLKQKWTEYLLEILVITIGILLAFSLNKWNESRLQNIEEKQILKNIHNEFLQNRILLQNKITLAQDSYKNAIKIINLMGSSREELASVNLDSLFYSMFPGTGDFLPSNNAINNIIQSGKLSLIANDSLINRLHDWQSLLEVSQYLEESSDKWITQNVIPFLIEYISMKEMDVYGGFEWTGKSKLKPDYYYLFQNLQFENTVDNLLFGLNRNINNYKEIDRIISDILRYTNL